MIKSRFSHLKWTAVVAVLAMTLIPSLRPSTAKTQPTPLVDLPNPCNDQERLIAKYLDDLFAYYKQAAQLSQKADVGLAFRTADLDPLQRKSNDLKARLSGVQNAFGEIVKILKAVKEWDGLDLVVANRAPDKAGFKQISFKQLLEEGSNNLASHGNEISIPLDNLRKRLTSRTFSPDGPDVQTVRAAYEATAPVKSKTLACTIGRTRIGLIARVGGTATPATWDQYLCACHGGQGIGVDTGVDCKSLQ